jgi:hypothetical protein
MGASRRAVNAGLHPARFQIEPCHYLFLFLSLSPDRSRILMDVPADDIDTVSSRFIAHDVPGRRPQDRESRCRGRHHASVRDDLDFHL